MLLCALMKISANNLSCITKKVKNIPLKLKREIFKIPPIQALKEQAYQKALNSHLQFLPKLDTEGYKIVDKLKEEGTCIIPIDDLQLSLTKKMMDTALTLADNLKVLNAQLNTGDGCELGSSKEDLREFPEMVLWALEPRLLDIIENYIGLPILYQGFAMRRSIADGKYSGVRRWHIDWEDRSVIKVIIYLNDVLPGGGPYNYISRQTTSEAIKKLNYYNLGYVSDEEMAAAVLKNDWNICLAPKGSVIISDTSSVFHRAQPPIDHERYSITFCYTSTMPQVIWNNRSIAQEQWDLINANINQRQRNCLHKKRIAQFM